MLKLFVISLILSQQIQNTVFGGKSKDDSSEPYEPLPFTMIKTQGGIKFPTHLLLKRIWFFTKKMLFYRARFIKQLIFCPTDSNKDEKLIEKANQIIKKEEYNLNRINKDCLFILKSFGQTFSSHFPRCTRQPDPVILKRFKYGSEGNKKEEGDSQRTCGPTYVIAKEYELGYQLCFKLGSIGHLSDMISKLFTKSESFPLESVTDYPVYSFCYDTNNKKTIYTKHRLSSPRLILDPELEKEREVKYQRDAESFNFSELDFEQIKTTYEKIDNLNSQQTENTLNNQIQTQFKIQNLVPPEDFPFALLRKPTFHWANAELMHEKLIKYWDHINKFIRRNADEYYREFTVYTGAFTISPPGSDEILTMEGIQIPQMWVKIIDNSYEKSTKHPQYRFIKKYIRRVVRQGVAIIANNYLNETVMKLIFSNLYCVENLCEHFGQKEFEDVHMHVLCCLVTNDLIDLFGVKLEFHSVYVIEGLIKINYEMPFVKTVT